MNKRVIVSIVAMGLGLGVITGGGFYYRSGRNARLLEQAVEASKQGNHDAAIVLYRSIAERGYVPAQRAVAKCYMDGRGVEQSYEEAAKILLPLAESGDSRAQAWLAVCYLKLGKPVEEIYPWLQKAAVQGEDGANLGLGMFYADGYGVEQSDEEAVKYFRKAAEAGNPQAQFRLADCYEVGRGVEQSNEQAIAWYVKAAEQGHGRAQVNLGFLYANKEMYEEAVQWFRKAAEAGNSLAQVNLAKCYKWGRGVEQSDEEAFKWTRKAVEQGDNVEAYYNLAYCYAEGIGVKKSMSEAFMLWKEIDEAYLTDLETGSKIVPAEFAIPTSYNLGLCYLHGDGIEENSTIAYIYIRSAAKAGHPKATQLLKEIWNENPTDSILDVRPPEEKPDAVTE